MDNAMTRFMIFMLFVLGIICSATVTYIVLDNKQPETAATGSGGLDIAAVESTIDAYLEAHPEVIVNAFTKARETQLKQQQEAAEKTISSKIDELEHSSTTPFAGNKNGDVVVVTFSDYNCGYCKRVMPDILALLKEDADVKFVHKDFPILGERSIVNAKASMAFFELYSNKWLDFHTEMLKDTPRNDDQLYALVAKMGGDVETFKKETAKPDYQTRIQENMQLGQSIGVRGTPAFVVDGEYIRGAVDLRTFKQKISEARQRG